MSPAKTAEEIEMPFGLRTWMGPGNHVLDRGPDPPIRPGKFEGGKGRSIVKYRDYSRLCKTAEPSKMPFGLRSCVGLGKYLLDGSVEVLRDVAMTTNFGMQFAINGSMAFDGL